MWLSVLYTSTCQRCSRPGAHSNSLEHPALEKIALQKSDSETEHILHIILNGTSTTA